MEKQISGQKNNCVSMYLAVPQVKLDVPAAPLNFLFFGTRNIGDSDPDR